VKIVTAPNAFKGSLTATEAAIAMEAGIRRIIPEAEVIQVPVADGGDGLVEVAVEAAPWIHHCSHRMHSGLQASTQ